MVISLWVNAASPIQLPISIMSGSIKCLHPPSESTPLIFNKFEPIPVILPPMLLIIIHNCWIYGSHAALYITVSPSAKEDAITRLAVPVTEG